MAVQSRDRRALIILGIAAILFLLLQTDFIPSGGGGSSIGTNVEASEEELLLAQTRARQKPVVDAEFKAISAQQEALEKGLLASETAALAQAEMRELIGGLLRSAGIAMKASRFGTVRLEGEDYTQIPLIVDFNCTIERFVNLMADIANTETLLSSRAIKVGAGNSETKSVTVQFTVSGYLPVSRTPELARKSSARRSQ
jgi:hypothetical protein